MFRDSDCSAVCSDGSSLRRRGQRYRRPVLRGGQEYRTTKVYVHPNYNPNRLGQDGANDIAIYKLDRPVTNVTPTPINRTAPAVGQLLTLVGFGGGGTGTTGHTGDYGTKRVGTTPIDQVTAQTIFWNFDNNNESNTAPAIQVVRRSSRSAACGTSRE